MREARVEVHGRVTGAIGVGLLALVGVQAGDAAADVAYVCRRIAAMRIFDGEAGGAVDVAAAGGRVLVVSQFTLLADMRRGRRPDFARAAPRATAREMIEAVVRQLEGSGLGVATGEFGADMQVVSVNDGPYTILLDSRTGREGPAQEEERG